MAVLFVLNVTAFVHTTVSGLDLIVANSNRKTRKRTSFSDARYKAASCQQVGGTLDGAWRAFMMLRSAKGACGPFCAINPHATRFPSRSSNLAA